MTRLAFLLVWPLTFAHLAFAQPAPTRIYRLGFISVSQGSYERFRQFGLPELAKRGFVEGQNLNIEARFGEPGRIPELSKDLVQTQPDVVVAVSSPVIRILAAAGPNVPVVAAFFGSDPVAEGMAATLGKPSGRITGIAMLSETLDAKRLDLLSETLPELRRVAVLAGRPPRHDANVTAMQEAAQRLHIELTVFEADTPDEYPAAFARMRAQRAQALVIASAPDFYRDAAVLAKAATNAGLPTICEWREMAESGCLLAYGPINADLTRRIAAYIVQILRGVPPGELPIEAPTRFDFTLNLKTAASLGLRLPPAALIRADEVIE